MTLAVAILLIGFSSTALLPERSIAQETSGQAPTANPSASAPKSPQQGTVETPQAPATKNTSQATGTPNGAKKSATKKRTHKKKVAISACDPVPGSGTTSTTVPGDTSTAAASAGSSSTTVPKNCPPEKIIVRQGGTAEPSIQLAGGDQAAQKRDATNQMLGSTEVNLKKISGQQLSESQQDTVAQIRQFVDQSRVALAAGDIERGHTLAWKAKVLSEDLVAPKQ